jgi:hypothetical protein
MGKFGKPCHTVVMAGRCVRVIQSCPDALQSGVMSCDSVIVVWVVAAADHCAMELTARQEAELLVLGNLSTHTAPERLPAGVERYSGVERSLSSCTIVVSVSAGSGVGSP